MCRVGKWVVCSAKIFAPDGATAPPLPSLREHASVILLLVFPSAEKNY